MLFFLLLCYQLKSGADSEPITWAIFIGACFEMMGELAMLSKFI